MRYPQQRRAIFSRREQGFSLVEMAVVLVIIGLILSAVVVGRDAQRNAEYIKIRQTFINQWAAAYHTYLQRMGSPIGDDPTAPRLMVNGAHYQGNGEQLSGGDMQGVSPPAAICHANAGPRMQRAMESSQGFDLRNLILQAGIELPQGRGQGMEDRYAYTDTNGNPQELQVCFQWNPPNTPAGSGNVMVITGLTPDLARFLASSLNGTTGANTQSFRQEGVTQGAGDGEALDWVGNNTNRYGESVANGTTYASNTRETQVLTVVANYKMTQ
ncbi:type II secretion system protein [Burkholderia gladioli]|uniref:type II secretion system protein n=1 Tax=Burkholderia gladioli TaxID=28095 RepID=UPI003F7B18B7